MTGKPFSGKGLWAERGHIFLPRGNISDIGRLERGRGALGVRDDVILRKGGYARGLQRGGG